MSSPITPMGAGDPVIATIYGDSGTGKSVDSVASFPRALIITPMKGSWKAVRRYFGLEPQEAVVGSISEAISVIKYLRGNPKIAQKFGGVVFDDVSILGERARVELQGRYKDPRQMFGELARQLATLREELILAGLHCVFNAHVNAPVFGKEGRREEVGGPKLTSRGQTTFLPAICETVLRVSENIEGTNTASAFGMSGDARWPRRYIIDHWNSDYVGKTRYGIGVAAPIPMNLREMLREAERQGHKILPIPRAPGTEWIDDVAETIAQAITSGQATSSQIPPFLRATFPNRDPRHLYWAHRDGCDRATFRALRDPFLGSFETPPTGRVGL